MRGKWIFLVVFSLFLIFVGIASAGQWAKIYGNFTLGSFVANSIKQTSDGGYIVAGYNTMNLGRPNVWVFKLDKDGNLQWQQAYSNGDLITSESVANSIQQTSDGGYIMAGYTTALGLYYEAWVFKLDKDGNIQWQKTYG
ncbi:MAG: hypothetical protein JHC25_03970, partial [Thermodesulfobacterium sp.]|nr:hypothetical protein [Thermodesulfobacterium sp.]